MNRERELLKRVYDWYLEDNNDLLGIIDDIEEELQKTDPEPVAIFRGKRLHPEGTKEFFGDLIVDDLEVGSRLYLSNQQQKPLTIEEIEAEHDATGRDQSNVGLASFMDGVRFSEEAHGIE